MKKYQVFQNDKPADITGYPEMHFSWDNSIFDTIVEASLHAYHWAGWLTSIEIGDVPMCEGGFWVFGRKYPLLGLNKKIDLSKYKSGDVMMEVRKVEV